MQLIYNPEKKQQLLSEEFFFSQNTKSTRSAVCVYVRANAILSEELLIYLLGVTKA